MVEAMARWKRERERKEEEDERKLLELKRNPLRSGSWVTPVALQNWEPLLCVAATTKSFQCWGVREALSFRAASSSCYSALQADGEWYALVLLSSSCQRTLQQDNMKWPKPEEWAVAYEKLMRFCLQDPTLDIRLELDGVEDNLLEEYAKHDALRFQPVHIAQSGVVSALQLGEMPLGENSDDIDCDWTEAPENFPQQLVNADSLRVVVAYRGQRTVFVEIHQEEDDDGWPASSIKARGGRLIDWHPSDFGFCCEFLVHIQISVPSAFLAKVVHPHLEQFYPFNSSSVPREPASTLAGPQQRVQAAGKLWLVCEFWHSHAVAYMHGDFHEEDTESKYYRRQHGHCCVEIPTSTSIIAEEFKSPLFMDILNSLPVDNRTLCFDMAYDVEDVYFDDTPDRVSFWAMDGNGRTYLQCHGVRLQGAPPDLWDSKKRFAYAVPLMLCVHFESKRLQLVLLVEQLASVIFGTMFSSSLRSSAS